MNYITPSNLADFAFVNEDTLVGPLRGICVNFHGYTDATMYTKSTDFAAMLGENGIAWVFPYYSVWAWMSSNSQSFIEQVLDATYEKLHADAHLPLIITGGSMGGLTALNYLVRGKRKATACALECPLADMHRFFMDRPNVRRAILNAHIEKEGDLHEITKAYSPVYFADRLPAIPYLAVYGEKDDYFTSVQMPLLVDTLDRHGLEHTVWVQPNMAHCAIGDHPDALSKYGDFIVSAVRSGGEKAK